MHNLPIAPISTPEDDRVDTDAVPSPRLTRREALKAGAVLIGALAVSNSCGATPRAKKVIVIGGGIGGLCCAFELMERGHEVTVLEASRRTGGHVKTIRAPLADGLYADVGAEHFTKPGYTEYWRYVEKFNLPALRWHRRDDMYRQIDGQWFTEQQLADPDVLRRFGFNAREVDAIVQHGWTERLSLYTEPYLSHFINEFQPLGVGLDALDHITFGDLLARDGASEAMLRLGGGRRSSPEKPPARGDVSALYRLWTLGVAKLRGASGFKRETYHLQGGNQLLPDTFAAKLGGRVKRNCPVAAIDHTGSTVSVQYEEAGRKQKLTANHVVICISPQMASNIAFTPVLPAAKAHALIHTVMSMQSRQSRA